MFAWFFIDKKLNSYFYIMKRIVSWLSKPYYFNPSIIFKLKSSLILGVFVFIFLYVFKPFSLASFEAFLLEYTFGIGVFTFLGVFLFMYVPPLIFTDYFNEDKWTVGRNILLIIISMLFIGSVLWYCASIYKDEKGITSINLPLFLLYTFLVGAIPVFFAVYINEKNENRKSRKRALEIKTHKKKKLIAEKKILETKIVVYSENKKEHVIFNINDLVYITSQGNYASFFLKKENDDLKEKILRVTLTKIENELENYSNVIRCHKSYLVNTKYITDINGNARGYLLKSDMVSFDIPVSRSFRKQSLMSLLD